MDVAYFKINYRNYRNYRLYFDVHWTKYYLTKKIELLLFFFIPNNIRYLDMNYFSIEFRSMIEKSIKSS